MVDVKHELLDVAGLQRELRGYEADYSRSSQELLRAFARGEIPKPASYSRWSFVYTILRRLGHLPTAA